MYIMSNGNIKLLEDHQIPKSLKFFSCSQHNIKVPITCYSSQCETGGEKVVWCNMSLQKLWYTIGFQK